MAAHEIQSLIRLNGVQVWISRDTGTTEDSQGDRVPAWGDLEDQEYVWIQHRSSNPTRDEGGQTQNATHTAWAKDTTLIQTSDILNDGTDRYEVLDVQKHKMYGSTTHKDLYLRLMEED